MPPENEKLITEVDYQLKASFGYAFKGDSADASFVTLKAPSSRHSRECSQLYQAFCIAGKDLLMGEGAKDDKEETTESDKKKEKINGREIITIIACSPDVSFPDVIETAKRLFLNGVAFVDGETKLTRPMLDLVNQDDLEEMLGCYLANFTLASLLARTKKPSSDGS